MPAEFKKALFKQRTHVDSKCETWESSPQESFADAKHLKDLTFDAPAASEWLCKLEPTPEEDTLAEVLTDSLEERGVAPSHSPAAGGNEAAERIRELAKAVEDMRSLLDQQKAATDSAAQDLARREAEVATRAKALEEERNALQAREEERRNYPIPKWLENVTGTMNLAVVGNAGVGKSLLINKLRRLRPHAKGWAPVGVNETTMEPTMYAFAGEARVRLWDLPGAGTPSYPLESYIQTMGLRYFDKVLIVTAGRFTATEEALRKELEEYKVPFDMVRTKVDIDVWNNSQDNSASEQETLRQITNDLKVTHSVGNLYLVSSRNPESYDMPTLMHDLFPGLKKNLDPTAPTFCPGATAWNDAWAMPVVLSASLSRLQGRWVDHYGAVYLIQGTEAHVTLRNGRSTIVLLQDQNEYVWWCARWWVHKDNFRRINDGRLEVKWTPANSYDENLVWWWCD